MTMPMICFADAIYVCMIWDMNSNSILWGKEFWLVSCLYPKKIFSLSLSILRDVCAHLAPIVHGVGARSN